jgi:hypothetical protein
MPEIKMLSTKRSFGVLPISVTSLANPTALKTKKTPSRKRKKDLRESVFQKDMALLIKSAALYAHPSIPTGEPRSVLLRVAADP